MNNHFPVLLYFANKNQCPLWMSGNVLKMSSNLLAEVLELQTVGWSSDLSIVETAMFGFRYCNWIQPPLRDDTNLTMVSLDRFPKQVRVQSKSLKDLGGKEDCTKNLCGPLDRRKPNHVKSQQW